MDGTGAGGATQVDAGHPLRSAASVCYSSGMANTKVSTRKDSPAQRTAIAEAAELNAADDQAALVNYGRVELNTWNGPDEGPLTRAS